MYAIARKLTLGLHILHLQALKTSILLSEKLSNQKTVMLETQRTHRESTYSKKAAREYASCTQGVTTVQVILTLNGQRDQGCLK